MLLLSLLTERYAWTMGRSYFWSLHVPISHLTHLFHVPIWIFSQKLLSGNEEPSRDFSQQGFQHLFLSCLSSSKLLGGYFYTIIFWLLLMLFLCYQFLNIFHGLYHLNLFSWIIFMLIGSEHPYHCDPRYKTHAIGKWHLGFCDEGYLPTRLDCCCCCCGEIQKCNHNSTGGALTPFLGCYNSRLTTGQ